ncbi:12214_t:CDS:1 [Ambispora gerdemannii]|uniref:12214_t:CDS:1 n=1 Tax=Ambispora gerdemannii TaxID=144530 RepID=A0A9N8ZRQ3_9GLOM|nr:12214_t:CDS:1 [Ambispora gerdemannii]
MLNSSNDSENEITIINTDEQKSKDNKLIDQLIILYYQQTLIDWDSTVQSTIEDWIFKNKHNLEHIINLLEQRKETSIECACLLGFFHHYGIGFETYNLEEAFQLYKHAADKDDSFANIQIGELYQITKTNHVKAKEAYKRAALLGHPQGAFKYALFLYNCKEKIYWVQASAEKGFEAAQRDMAGHCHYGYGVLKDDHRALSWLLKYSKNNPRASSDELMSLYFYYY